MKFVNIIDTFRGLADDSSEIVGFYTGLGNEVNDSLIQYPSMRIHFPYSVEGNINTDNNLLTYSFKLTLLVNNVELITNGPDDVNVIPSMYEVNTNYNTQDNTLNEISSPIVDEMALRERAIRIMMHYIEGLRIVEENSEYFTIDSMSLSSLERYANDFVTGVELDITISTGNEYACEAISNVNYSVWKDSNGSLLDIDYNERGEVIIPNCFTKFNGIDEYITIGDSTSFNYDVGDTFSCSAWVYLSSYNRDFIITKYNLSILRGWFLAISNTGALAFSVQNNGNIKGIQVLSPVSSVPLNQWTLLTASCNGSGLASGIELRIDNVVQAKTVTFDNLAGNSFTTSTIPRIGVETNTSFFLGNLSNAAIFNTVLSAGEVATIYNEGRANPDYSSISNLVSHWKLNTLDPIDEIGINNGTSFNMDTSNIICEPYTFTCYSYFNGINEYINVPHNTNLSFERTDAFSVSFWFDNKDLSLPNAFHITKREPLSGTSPYPGWEVVTAGSVMYLYLVVSTGNVYATSTTYTTGLNHWTLTYDGSSNSTGLSIYKNGVDVTATRVGSVGSGTMVSTAPLTISGWLRPAINFVQKGDMSQVTIWNKELSIAEAVTIYNEGRTNPDYSTISNLVSYWKLDSIDPIDEEGINDGTSVNMDSSNIICEI